MFMSVQTKDWIAAFGQPLLRGLRPKGAAILLGCFFSAYIVTSPLTGSALAVELTYQFDPLSVTDNMHNAYSVSGTITTDGTLGVLTAQNIVGFEVVVDGEHPFNFSSSDEESILIIDESIVASLTELSAEEGKRSYLTVIAANGECEACEARVLWGNVPLWALGSGFLYGYESDGMIQAHSPSFWDGNWNRVAFAHATLLGDCNEDGDVNAADLGCVATVEQRNQVLATLNTQPGDLDGDGQVNFSDFLTLSANFGDPTMAAYTDGDVDLSGVVAFPDFLLLAENYTQVSASNQSAVPEPSGGIMAGFFAVLSTLIRRPNL